MTIAFSNDYNKGMKVLVENFIANVNDLLHRRGWSRAEFARRLGVTPGYVTQILNGHHEPGLRVVETWAATLGVTAAYVLREKKVEKIA